MCMVLWILALDPPRAQRQHLNASMASIIAIQNDIMVTSSKDRIMCSMSDMISMVRMSGPLYNIAGACSSVTRSLRDVCCLSVSTTTASSSSFSGRCSIATGSFQTTLWRRRQSHLLRSRVSSLQTHLVAVMGSRLSTNRIALTQLASLSVSLLWNRPKGDCDTSFGQHLKHLLWTAESI